MDFEYAIRKDIRNNAVIRELDSTRQKELWHFVVLCVLLVGVLLFSAWQHFELLRHGYQVGQMEQQRAEEDEISRHLRLEIETLRSPKRIERVATDELDMVAPAHDQAVVIERVTPPQPPSKSMVAMR